MREQELEQEKEGMCEQKEKRFGWQEVEAREGCRYENQMQKVCVKGVGGTCPDESSVHSTE